MNQTRKFATGAVFPFPIASPKRPAFALLWGLLAWCLLAGTALASSHETVSKAEFDEVLQRLEKLEARQAEQETVSPMKALDLKIGGIFSQSFTTVFTDSAFDETNLELLISANLSENVDFFTAIGWLFSVRLDEDSVHDRDFIGGGTFSNQRPLILWARGRFSEALHVRVGRYITPWGIIHREHFPDRLLSMEQPQHLQPINGELGGFNTIATFVSGGQVNGRFVLGATSLEYAVYIGNYTGPDPFIEGKDIRGVLLGVGLAEDRVRFGLNAQAGKKPILDADKQPLPGKFNSYDVVGTFLRLELGPFLFKSEYFKNNIDKIDNDQEGFYVQPAFEIGERHVVFYRFDTFDGNTEENLTTMDLTEGIQQIVGYNYLPIPNVRLRTEFVQNTFEEDLPVGSTVEERDFEMLRFSGVFSF